MLRLAWRTVRARRASLTGAFVSLSLAVALVAGFGIVLESALRAGAPPERLAAAPVVVAARQTVTVGGDAVPLAERARVPVGIARRIARIRGVRAALPDISFPAYLVTAAGALVAGAGDGPSLGHSWASAALAPFRLTVGHAPAGPGQVVVDAGLARRAGAHVGERLRIEAAVVTGFWQVAGIAAPVGEPGLQRQSALFFSPGQAARLYGHHGRADAIGVLLRSGAADGTVLAGVRRTLAGTSLSAIPAGTAERPNFWMCPGPARRWWP